MPQLQMDQVNSDWIARYAIAMANEVGLRIESIKPFYRVLLTRQGKDITLDFPNSFFIGKIMVVNQALGLAANSYVQIGSELLKGKLVSKDNTLVTWDGGFLLVDIQSGNSFGSDGMIICDQVQVNTEVAGVIPVGCILSGYKVVYQ